MNNQTVKCPPQKSKRTFLFTLVFYTDAPRQTQYLRDMLTKIIGKYSCRIIFIHDEKDQSKDFFDVKLSEESNVEDSSIVSDQIIITASGKSVERIPFILLTYVVPDLPIFLVWGSDPTKENKIFCPLQKMATTIIFDLELSDHIQKFCQKMLEFFKSSANEIVDMNWVRIFGWRDVISKTFQEEECFRNLEHAKLIQITYNTKESTYFVHQEISSIYLQGWLAGQLKYQFSSLKKEKSKISIEYKNITGHLVKVELIPKKRDDIQPESILSVAILSENGQSYMISRQDSSPYVSIATSSAETCEIPYTLPLPGQHRDFSFLREVFYGSQANQYVNMLKVIANQGFQYDNR